MGLPAVPPQWRILTGIPCRSFDLPNASRSLRRGGSGTHDHIAGRCLGLPTGWRHGQVGRDDRVFLQDRLGAQRCDSLYAHAGARTDMRPITIRSHRRPLPGREEHPTDRDDRKIDCELRKTCPCSDCVRGGVMSCGATSQSLENSAIA